MPVISVILPSCDSQAWIVEAVQSVLKQTHQQLELLVIDDASQDNTLKILERYTNDSRVTIIKRQHRSGGPATPRNEGIKAARGDYLAFIDSDDVWHPRKLELQILAMQEYKLNFISSLRINFREFTPVCELTDKPLLSIKRKSHQQLLNKNWVVTSSALISAGLLTKINFNQATEYQGVEDYLYWLHIHQRKDIQSAVLQIPLVFYRLRQDSISSSKLKMAKKILYLLRHYRINGKPIRLKAYYFFSSYTILSIINLITKGR